MGGGGGDLRTVVFKIICFNSNSITFYRSLGMRNQVETQKERSQGTSIQQNSIHYLRFVCKIDGKESIFYGKILYPQADRLVHSGEIF